MKVDIISDSEGEGEYLIVHGEVDRASAEAHFFDRHMTMGVQVKHRLLRNNELLAGEDQQKIRQTLIKMAVESWPTALAEMKSEPVPEYLTTLLRAEDKKAQIRALKGATINAKQLGAFILEAEQYGFTYSKYLEKHLPGNVDRSNLPRFFEKRADGTVKTAGKTSMSDAQLKQVLDQRKATVATILDRGDDWHCFFATYRGLAGEENYKAEQGGQAHYHYISSKWGSVTRQQVVDAIRSGTYLSTSVHIDLLDFDTAEMETTEQSDTQTLPSFPVVGTGIQEDVWLSTNASVYAHYYQASTNVASCGRYNTIAQVQAAWANKNAVGKPHCPSCERRVAHLAK
jgi:hypothetical protein